jgi:hypothetical protein
MRSRRNNQKKKWIMFCFQMKQFQNKPRHQGTTSINTNQYQMNVEVNEGQVKGGKKNIE